jgi:DNA-directed RNA polymerase subunit L
MELKMIKQATKRELVRNAILELADANGHIDRRAVFEAARSPNSVLHSEFEWDGEAAILELGLQRASELIRVIKIEVVVDSHKIVAPYYINHPSDSKNGVYVPLAGVKDDATIKQGVLINEVSRIESAIKRARAIAGALDLENEFDAMMSSVNNIRSRLLEVA